jgi:GAF domain-containing protein
MLAPVVGEDRLVGIVSVHYAPGPRTWASGDVSALEEAVEHVLRALD